MKNTDVDASSMLRPEINGFRNVRLLDREGRYDLLWEDGVISVLRPHDPQEKAGDGVMDGGGNLLLPPFVDSHFHLDSVLTRGQPRLNQSGTLREGIALWKEYKATLTEEDVWQRANRYCAWAVARGIGAIRSHVDVSEPSLAAVRALLQVRREWAGLLDIQLVAFPQDGYLADPETPRRMREALDLGVDVVGGIPHGERTYAEGTESIRQLCALAAERQLPVDIHCDETDDPASRHVETLARETLRHGLEGRVSASHLTSLHSIEAAPAARIIALMAEAGLHAIPNPLINITLQGRYDGYPKRRGLTRIDEMRAAGLNVSLGHDCVADPWYPLGSGDMLAVASMACHAGLLMGPEDFRAMLHAVTGAGARTLGLTHYGLRVGGPADGVLLHARSAEEALRLLPERLWVIRRGRVVGRQETARAWQWREDSVGIRVDFHDVTGGGNDSGKS